MSEETAADRVVEFLDAWEADRGTGGSIRGGNADMPYLFVSDLRALVAEVEQGRRLVQADPDSAAGRIAYWLDCWQTFGAEAGLPDEAQYIAGPPPSAEPRASAADFDAVLKTLGAVLAACASATAEVEQLRAERGEARDALAVAAALLDRFSAENPCTEGGDTCRVHGYARKPCPHPLARQFVDAWRAVEADAASRQPAGDGKAER